MVDDPNSSAPAGSLTHYALNQNESLESFSTSDLFAELIKRTCSDNQAESEEQAVLSHRLWTNLRNFSDVHHNRHSVAHLKSIYFALVHPNIGHRLPVKDATWVDLGCGSVNPWSFSFLLLALGAKQAIPIDLDPVGDSNLACLTLAEIAKSLLVNPASIIQNDCLKITPHEVVNNLYGFDLHTLSRGSVSGIPESRLGYRSESVYEMTVPQASVDVVASNSFLEHVPDVDGAVAAIAGITKPGGYGVHVIDTVDHRFYGHSEVGPLGFLTVDSDEPLIHGCNRLRPKEFIAIFEKHGFEILDASYSNLVSLTDDQRSAFIPPWSSMPVEDLKPTAINIAVRLRK
jgi:SAM-dependent methyltransferase